MGTERYKITRWKVNGKGPIPKDGFKKGDILLSEQPDRGVQARKLSWRDGACSIESLPFDIPSPVVDVRFGPDSVKCLVRVEPTNKGIKGTLTWTTGDGNDGNTGTFIAEANNGIDGSA